MTNYYVWNKDSEEFEPFSFAFFEAAEDYVLRNGGYEKYDIFEKLS